MTFWHISNINLSFLALYSLFFLLACTLSLRSKSWTSFALLFVLAAAARLWAFGQTPGLSEDYARFLWDGFLWQEGIHPFLYKPEQLAAAGPLPSFLQELYPLLNSPNYYTVYPPAAQLLFYLAALPRDLFWGIELLRTATVLGELGTLYFLYKLLGGAASPKLLLLYWLSPLLLIESSYNLHFEPLQTAALLGALYALQKKRLLLSALALAAAVSVKLSSLLALPFVLLFLWKRGERKQALLYAFSTINLLVLAFALLLRQQQAYIHIGASINLYIQRFEFHASLYYLLRELLYYLLGFNPIAVLGPGLLLFFCLLALWQLWRFWQGKQGLYRSILYTWTLYYICSTTVHPWYLLNLLPLALLLRPLPLWLLLWSCTAFWSYAHYFNPQPVLLLLSVLSYLPVFLLFFSQNRLKPLTNA